jgi:hypothetical protein
MWLSELATSDFSLGRAASADHPNLRRDRSLFHEFNRVHRRRAAARHEPDQQARKFHLFQELSNIDQRLWNPEGNVCSSSLVFGIHR